MYIHVGFPRCASTFLQSEVFPKLNLCYIKRKEHLQFNMTFKSYYNKYILGDHKYRDKLYSSETIVGLEFWKPDAFDNTLFFSHFFPDANIIIVRRERDSWLSSMYHRYIEREGLMDYDLWFDTVLNQDLLDVDGYIARCKYLFSGCVLVLDYELLVEDDREFVGRICDFVGVPMPKYINKIVNANKYKLKGV